jgi:hypothetical protein
MYLLSCLSKELGDTDKAEIDTGPVIDLIMESYSNSSIDRREGTIAVQKINELNRNLVTGYQG